MAVNNDKMEKNIKFSNHLKLKFKEVYGLDYTLEDEKELLALCYKYKPFNSFSLKHGKSSYYTFYYKEKLITIVVAPDEAIAVTLLEETHKRKKYLNRT